MAVAQDAPDYTLLSDVNVIGSVALNVNVVGSVAIDVNVTNSSLDVHITESTTINVNIVNATLNVSITNAYLDVRIIESVTINANIVNASLNVNVTNSYLDVHITESVTIDANITNAVLNVNITNSSIDVNVVGGSLNVNITNQVLLTGQNPPALSFDGINDYVDCGTKDIFKLSSALTIEGWFKLNPDTPVGRGVIQKNPGTSDYDYMLYLSSLGHPGFYLKTPDATVYAIHYTKNIRDGEWHHWVGTFDGTYMRLYIDGELKAESDTGGVSIRTSNTPLYIFRGWRGYLMGFARNIRMYNRALSAAEVIHNNQNPYSPTTSGLILWLKMDEGAGTTAYDSSGLGNHGTIYGATWVSSQGAAPTLVNVNVTNAQVNINITGQAINVKIENPAGIPLYVAQPVRVSRATAAGSSGRPANILIRSVTGRSRLLGIVVDVLTTYSWYELSNNIINIIVDGVQNPLHFDEIASWNGGLPFLFPPDAGSYIEAKFLSELGGWTLAYETTWGYRYLRLMIQLQFDALSSLEIWLFVPGDGADVSYRIYSIVGFYP